MRDDDDDDVGHLHLVKFIQDSGVDFLGVVRGLEVANWGRHGPASC